MKDASKMSKRELRLEVLDLRESRRVLRKALLGIVEQKSCLLADAQAAASKTIEYDDNI